MSDVKEKMASSSSLLCQINSDFLTCQICMDTFKKPKVLNCQHSFCQVCLDSCTPSESGSYMSCPVCRERTLLGMKGVSGLKDNFVFSNMIEMLDTWNRSKSPRCKSSEALQDKEVMCSTCPTSDEVMATFQCLHCLDHLCGDCAAFHNRTKLTKEHEVVLLEEIENGIHEEKIRLLEISRCKDHEIEMNHYCADCNVPLCKDCVIEKHQSHVLQSIKEAEADKREKVSNIKTELDLSIQQLEERLHGIESTSKKQRKKFQEKKESIHEKANQIIAVLQKKKAHLIEEVEKVEKGNLDAINACKGNLETQLKCMDNCAQLSSHLLEGNSPFEIITMHQQITDTIDELNTKTEEVNKWNNSVIECFRDIKLKFGEPEEVLEIFGVVDAAVVTTDKTENPGGCCQETNEKFKPKTMPRPTPRRQSSGSEIMRNPPTPTMKRSPPPLVGELEQHDKISDEAVSCSKLRASKPKPLARPRSQMLSQSTLSLPNLSPVRKAPVPPLSPPPQKQNLPNAPKKPKAPRPPSSCPPLPPPQYRKPKASLYPLRATRFVKFGNKGKVLSNGEFTGPPKCARFTKLKKKILVLDAESRHVLVFSIDGVLKKSFNVAVNEQAQAKPVDIAESGTTHILILFKNFITKWSWDRKMEHVWGKDDLIDANCITTDSKERILVSDQEKHMIFIYDPQTGDKILQFGGFGDRDELLKSPRYICINHFDEIIVSDHHNNCVKIFDKEGRFLKKFGDKGTSDGQLKYPEGITTVPLGDGSDGILIADEGNCRVSLFTSEGRLLGHALTRADDRGLKSPQFISTSSSGDEMVVRQSHEIQLRVYKLVKVGV